MRDKTDTLVLITTLLAVLFGFAFTGQRDYADAVTAERDALRAQLRVCRAGAEPSPGAPARHLTRLER